MFSEVKDLQFDFTEFALLCQTDRYSLAGEFFPEAAQIAYKMWELSAMTKVQVCLPSAPTSDVSLHVWLDNNWNLERLLASQWLCFCKLALKPCSAQRTALLNSRYDQNAVFSGIQIVSLAIPSPDLHMEGECQKGLSIVANKRLH